MAARKAKSIADKFSAELYLVHVIEPFPAYAYPGFAGFTEVEAPLRDHAEGQLEKLADSLQVPKKRQFLEIGAAKNEVLSLATELGVDLIITGSHNKRGLAHLLGSISNAITQHAACDVLIVRSA